MNLMLGSSILKLVYRSKEDYQNGKPKDVGYNLYYVSDQLVVIIKFDRRITD